MKVSQASSRSGLLLVLIAAASPAHHGVAPHYDDERPVRIEGVVERFDFINPHSFLYVRAPDDSGGEQVWQCELASRSVLSRNGLTRDTFRPGEPITVEGIAGRRNPVGCALRTAYFTDGSVLRSTEFFGPASAGPPEIPDDPASIAGVWTMKTFSVSFYEGVLTEAGERAREAFDPIADDPAIYCNPSSPVRFWINVNEPFEIRIEDDSVVIDHSFLDSQRVVHLDERPPGADVPRGPMGYSRGHFEGKALVVTTDHFTAATLEPRRAVMHTEDLVLTERLEVDESTGELEISWVIDDPAYFREPLRQTELFVRSQRDSEPYDCKPGYQQ